jgi:hypothetical protein
MKSLKEAMAQQWRYITFRPRETDFRPITWAMFFGVSLTVLLAGFCRWWDDAHAVALQKAGVGSLIYTFVLALCVYVCFAPFAERKLGFLTAWLLVAMTAPYGFIYAIPFELFLSSTGVVVANSILLTLVSISRIAALVVGLRRLTGIATKHLVVAMGLMLSAILTVMLQLKLFTAALASMGGFRELRVNGIPAEWLSWVSMGLFAIAIVLGVAWLSFVLMRRTERQARADEFPE